MDQLWCDFRKLALNTLLALTGILFAVFPIFMGGGAVERVLALLPLAFSTLQSLLDCADRDCLPGWAASERLVKQQGRAIALSVVSTVFILFYTALLLSGFRLEMTEFESWGIEYDILPVGTALAACVCSLGSIANAQLKLGLMRRMWGLLYSSSGTDRPGSDYITPMLWEVKRHVRKA